jgi:hypothetical protein
MDSEDLLSQLADIHLPAQVSYWPPAPGWWVLAILLLIGLVYLAYKLRIQAQQAKIRQYALAELDGCMAEYATADSSEPDANLLRYVNAVNSVLRRVALVHFPNTDVAGLGGQAWVDFIRQKGDSSLLNEQIAAALSHGRFQTRVEVDSQALYELGRSWINSLYQHNHRTTHEAVPLEGSTK